jgi:hypothetical protein
MPELLKARVHLIVSTSGDTPFSYRAEILALTRDPQWVYSQATVVLHQNLSACGVLPWDIKILSNPSIEWVPLRSPRA